MLIIVFLIGFQKTIKPREKLYKLMINMRYSNEEFREVHLVITHALRTVISVQDDGDSIQLGYTANVHGKGH